MNKEHLYVEQLTRFKRGEVFDAHNEYISQYGIKSGRFGEQLIQEILGDNFATGVSNRKIKRANGRYYSADGYIPSLDIYLESKFLTFCTAGTAPEKLPYFLFKAEEYDKPVVLILGGEHELLKDEPSYYLWTAYNEPERCSSKAALTLVNAVRHKIAGIVKLSELRDWVNAQEAKLKAL